MSQHPCTPIKELFVYGTPDHAYTPADAAGVGVNGVNGAGQTVVQLAAALVDLAEAQRATDQKLAQLVAANQEIVALQRAEAQRPLPVSPLAVTVTDVSMSFGSMVIFMVKWVIASIPAAIALALIGGAVIIGFGLFLGILAAR
jgi:CHASE2 domain-containing sensor protein